jgi:hypothetical protein
MKTMDEYFRDWYEWEIGYGYGTGEEHVLPSLRQFLETCSPDDGYDYRNIEKAIGGSLTWLFISVLAKSNIIEYGTSPRFGWLTPMGKRLYSYLVGRSGDELYDAVCIHDKDYSQCTPDYCNCGPNGYENGKICLNPFWMDRPA